MNTRPCPRGGTQPDPQEQGTTSSCQHQDPEVVTPDPQDNTTKEDPEVVTPDPQDTTTTKQDPEVVTPDPQDTTTKEDPEVVTPDPQTHHHPTPTTDPDTDTECDVGASHEVIPYGEWLASMEHTGSDSEDA